MNRSLVRYFGDSWGPLLTRSPFSPSGSPAHLRRPAEGLGLDCGPPKWAYGPASSNQGAGLSPSPCLLPRAALRGSGGAM